MCYWTCISCHPPHNSSFRRRKQSQSGDYITWFDTNYIYRKGMKFQQKRLYRKELWCLLGYRHYCSSSQRTSHGNHFFSHQMREMIGMYFSTFVSNAQCLFIFRMDWPIFDWQQFKRLMVYYLVVMGYSWKGNVVWFHSELRLFFLVGISIGL